MSSEEETKRILNTFPGGNVNLDMQRIPDVAILQLDHPEKRNAISGVMMVQLREAVDALAQWGTGKAVIICGKSGNFCSGGDLDFISSMNKVADSGAIICSWMAETFRRLKALDIVSVAIVEGPTLGGGTELALAADYIVATDNAKFGLVHGKMGITTAWGGGTRLVRKIGYEKALDLLLTSRILSAAECYEMGIANVVVSSADPLQDTYTWLSTRLQHHYSVMRAMKKVAYFSSNVNEDEALVNELKECAQLWGGELNKKAITKRINHLKK